MVIPFTFIVSRNRGQTAQLDLSPQGINDSHYVFQPQGGLASLKVYDEAHPHPRCQRQLGLCQPELLASGTKCCTELLRRLNGCHGFISFPFGKLSAITGLCASDISRSGILIEIRTWTAPTFPERECLMYLAFKRAPDYTQ
jgi:hypothetical protein